MSDLTALRQFWVINDVVYIKETSLVTDAAR